MIEPTEDLLFSSTALVGKDSTTLFIAIRGCQDQEEAAHLSEIIHAMLELDGAEIH